MFDVTHFTFFLSVPYPKLVLEYCLVVGYPYLFMDLAARWLNFGLVVNFYTWTLMAVVGGARWLVIVNNYVNSGYA